MRGTLRSWVICLGLIGAAGIAAGQTTLKVATLVPQGSAWHLTLQEMAQQWEKGSGGKVTVRLYPGGVAGDDGDVVRKMRLGTLDGGLLTVAGLADIDRSIFALAIPMAYASYEELDHVAEALWPQLAKTYEAKGFVVLAWADAGWVRFFSKTAVRTPDDLKTQKLFTWAGDAEGVEMWKSAGFNPVPLPSTELSTAIQTGLVTAIPTTPQAAVLLQWFTHAKFMTDLNWAVLSGAIVVSKASWARVPEEVRPALVAAARTAARTLQTQSRQGEAAGVEAMVKRGLTVVHVDATALAAWNQAVEAAYPRVRGHFLPADMFDEAMRIRAEYRAGAAKAPTR
jgi:TRAP-type C4-dicarboxylate transport system substrate-binding protein